MLLEPAQTKSATSHTHLYFDDKIKKNEACSEELWQNKKKQLEYDNKVTNHGGA